MKSLKNILQPYKSDVQPEPSHTSHVRPCLNCCDEWCFWHTAATIWNSVYVSCQNCLGQTVQTFNTP